MENEFSLTNSFERESIEFGDDSNETISQAKIEKIKENSRNVVVFSTDWTTETIINQIRRGNINLNPDFQRRDAWQKNRKSKFIESLFLGLPVPQIVIAESKLEKGKYIVIDGKQRLLTLMQFYAEKNEDYGQLTLSGLEMLRSLNGKNKSRIGDGIFEGEDYIDISAFDNQAIRTVVIRNWTDEAVLYEIFLRLNQGSVALSPQELRQALLPGAFTKMIDEAAPTLHVIRSTLKLTEKNKADRRMRDSELLLRYIAFRNFISQYKGDLKEFYDNVCIFYNLNWLQSVDDISMQVAEMEAAYSTLENIFSSKHVFRKWTKDRFETRVNRPLFDLMLYYFSLEEVRRMIVGNEGVFIENFKSLCENQVFRSSIESGTNNIHPTQIRYKMFSEMLSSILHINIVYPSIEAYDAGTI
ncbi:DUF262 domain-containing protein [Deinococcus taklimakanensis]|uniref:DUF262 domain-containing protein n=1 Tax=Deinococcus taklimakanensis TaxID=536443 RepID=A0ABW5NZT1_9DEIO